ncbi:MAG: radical SAM protein, partial [Cyclobacteriaceae bacterium]|nr:radical SAM protein [Cyclobacteriaceae bacterium HetDA_MAG_MS6]
GFDTILERLSRLPVALKITTNGILIDKYADHLVDAGITSLNVSIDTLRKDRFQAITRRDYFDRVMKNIGLATRSGMDVVLNVVLMRGKNDDEIPAFVQYACDRGIRIKFIEFMPFQRNEWSLSKSVGEQEVLQVINQSFSRVKKLMDPPNSTSQNYQVGGSGRFGVVSTVTNPFCGTCNRIRLTANGKLKNCLFSNGETDILTSYRQGLDIQPLIRNALAQKKWSRGGMNSNDDFNDTKAHQGNRPMIAIGG